MSVNPSETQSVSVSINQYQSWIYIAYKRKASNALQMYGCLKRVRNCYAFRYTALVGEIDGWQRCTVESYDYSPSCSPVWPSPAATAVGKSRSRYQLNPSPLRSLADTCDVETRPLLMRTAADTSFAIFIFQHWISWTKTFVPLSLHVRPSLAPCRRHTEPHSDAILILCYTIQLAAEPIAQPIVKPVVQPVV